MLEVRGQAMIPGEKNADDFLDITAFASGATFTLASWGPCHDVDDDDDDSDDDDDNINNNKEQVLTPWRTLLPQHEHDDCWSSASLSSSEHNILARRKVRFHDTPQIRHYDKPTEEHWSRLYYSCHELQKIVDDYRLEQQEWQDECAKYAESAAEEKELRRFDDTTNANKETALECCSAGGTDAEEEESIEHTIGDVK